MSIDRSRRTSFEAIADLYNEARPSYPAVLVDEIIRLSALPPDGHILEIGCGAGNATLPFASRGYSLVGVELGARLAAYARQRCRAFPNALIVQAAFEDYPLPPHSFDLAISAEAFHWIEPEIGYPKLLHALKPTGALALFWHIVVDPQTAWSRAVDDAFRRCAPQVEPPHRSFSLAWLEEIIRGNLRRYCGLHDVTVRTFEWSEMLDAARFIALLRTYSSLRDLDAATRSALHADVRAVIEHCGGSIEKPYQVALFHAQVTQDG